MKMAAVGGK